jgi:hypothetical protein
VRDQVGKDVCWAPIEDPVRPVLGNGFDRSRQLRCEVFEAGYLAELVPLLQEEVVGLVDCRIGRERSKQFLDEGCLSGSMRS